MASKMQTWILFVALWSGGLSLRCLDFNGNYVDWYSVYKIPKETESPDWKIKDGLGHFYLDVHSPHWTLSDQAMNGSQHAVANTLNQIYNAQNTDILYIMYNDESPKKSSDEKLEDDFYPPKSGHTKGVVAFDNESGFWLIHSTPKFPPNGTESYTWPKSGEDYGQTFLCISLPIEQLGTVATQLFYNYPDIYDHNIPAVFSEKFPLLKDLIARKKPSSPPWYSIKYLTSVEGQNFTSFAKFARFGADLYDDLVAPTLKQDLLVETWLRGEGTALDSNCTAEHKVFKVTDISLPQDITFKETKDHAKWAVTYATDFNVLKFKSEKVISAVNAHKWICIGDINRMESQFKRGGGTACLQNTDVWHAFRDAVADYEKCP